MHGAVPPNYNGPGIPATNEPIATNGYDLINHSGGAPIRVIPSGLTGYSIDGGTDPGDTLAIAKGRFTRSTGPVCPNGPNGELTTSGCSGKGDLSSDEKAPNLAPVVAKARFPLQVAHVSQTDLTSDGISGTVYTPSIAGTYRISFTIYVTTAGTGGNINANIAYNTGSGTVSSGYQGSAAANVLTSPGYYQGIAHVVAGQAITYQTHFASVTGKPVYGIDVIVERLQ